MKIVQKAMEEHGYNRQDVPLMIKKILDQDKWKLRKVKDDLLESREFSYFPNFVEAPRPWGLQTEWKVVQDLCQGYAEVELAIGKAKNRKFGENQSGSINNTTQKKTTKEKQLMQLERERPDLLSKVNSGELSAHAAFLEAGIRSPNLQTTNKPESVASMIKKHFTAEEIAKIVKLLLD